MDLELHINVWKEMKEHFSGNDAKDAAEDFVRILIEHGASADEFSEYAIDSEIKNALLEYTELDEDEYETEDEYDE